MNAKIRRHLEEDPKLKLILAQVKLEPLELSDDLYFHLIRSIVFQQLSGKAASTIHGRFLQLFAEEYPYAEQLVEMETTVLRSAGLSNQKASYVKNIAEFWIKENLQNQDLYAKTDDEIITYLTQIKGVGRWTVQMMLMFAMGREDVLPLDDLVVGQGIQKLYNIEGKGKELKKKMITATDAWRPYRSYGSRLMWKMKDTVV